MQLEVGYESHAYQFITINFALATFIWLKHLVRHFEKLSRFQSG